MYDSPSTTSTSYADQPGVFYRGTKTHKLNTVHFGILLGFEVLNDIPLIHPLGDQAQLVFADRCTEEGEDVRVTKVFPRHGFSAESLHLAMSTWVTK